jgi:hypothetical protein
MDPSAMRLRILGPLIYSGDRDILEVALPSVCCSHGSVSCGLCSNWIGGGAVYMYK